MKGGRGGRRKKGRRGKRNKDEIGKGYAYMHKNEENIRTIRKTTSSKTKIEKERKKTHTQNKRIKINLHKAFKILY